MEECSSAFKILTGKPTGKRPLGSFRCRWDGNVRMDFEEIDISTRNYIESTQTRDYWKACLNLTLNLWDP